jgi:AraC-like DNA-binding protein
LIHYYSPVIADRQAHRGYVHGIDKDNHHYVLCVEYDKTPAPLTLYYTDPLPDAGFPEIVLTDDGNLMIIGGINYNKNLEGSLENDNFSPLATVFLLHVSNRVGTEAADKASRKWLWLILALAVLAIAAVVFIIRKRRNSLSPATDTLDSATLPHKDLVSDNTSAPNPNEVLMQRICDLMEQQQPYLNNNLKLIDVATMLGTNRNVISNCINTQRDCSFSQFVNNYRVSHAQKLIRRQPDMKISEIWMASGFSTESSFFRSFKAVTGMTPSEYKAQIG